MSARLTRSPAYGSPAAATREASDRTGKCDATTTSGAWSVPVRRLPDVLRRRRPLGDPDAGDGDAGVHERLLVQEPDPVPPRGRCELVAEAEVVIAVHRRERSDVRRREAAERMLQVARVGELDEVAEHEDQVDRCLAEPRERRVEAPVELLGLEGVDPARARRLELAVEIAEDADAHDQRPTTDRRSPELVPAPRPPRRREDAHTRARRRPHRRQPRSPRRRGAPTRARRARARGTASRAAAAALRTGWSTTAAWATSRSRR